MQACNGASVCCLHSVCRLRTCICSFQRHLQTWTGTPLKRGTTWWTTTPEVACTAGSKQPGAAALLTALDSSSMLWRAPQGRRSLTLAGEAVCCLKAVSFFVKSADCCRRALRPLLPCTLPAAPFQGVQLGMQQQPGLPQSEHYSLCTPHNMSAPARRLPADVHTMLMCTGIPQPKQLLAPQKAGGQQGLLLILDTSRLPEIAGNKLDGHSIERCLPDVLPAGAPAASRAVGWLTLVTV